MSHTDHPILGPKFEEALQLATRLHNEQVRKMRRVPYISHLLSVTALVLQDGGTEVEACAALLHDAAEDQGGENILSLVREQFGDQVADIVAACSDTFEDPKPPWKERKLAHIKHTKHASPQVQRVILADKLHNARSLLRDVRAGKEEIWDSFHGGKDGTLWYLESFHTLLADACPGYFLDEFGRVLSEIKRIAGEE